MILITGGPGYIGSHTVKYFLDQNGNQACHGKMMKCFDKAYEIRYVSLRYFNAAGAHESGIIGEDHHPEAHLIFRWFCRFHKNHYRCMELA